MPSMRSILVVDDDPSMRVFLEHYLGRHYTVDLAESGAAGLRMLHAGDHDLALVDLSMPGLTGFELTEIVRADRRFDALALVVLSGSESSADRVRALESGADDFVVKPFNPAELAARVAAVFRRADRLAAAFGRERGEPAPAAQPGRARILPLNRTAHSA